MQYFMRSNNSACSAYLYYVNGNNHTQPYRYYKPIVCTNIKKKNTNSRNFIRTLKFVGPLTPQALFPYSLHYYSRIRIEYTVHVHFVRVKEILWVEQFERYHCSRW